MAETSHEIRREIAQTRERVGDTIAELERKINPRHIVQDHPLALLGVAFGTGVLLATTGAAKRAVDKLRSQRQHGTQQAHPSETATSGHTRGHTLDSTLNSLLNSLKAAATEAITAKVTEVLARSAEPSSQPVATAPPVENRAA